MNKMRILVFGAHAADPESGAGGTIANLARDGNEVIITPLTHNERVRPDKTAAENAADTIREAGRASKILGAELEFMNFVNGEMSVDDKSAEIVSSYIREKKPDVIFTHWPIDTHPEHQATGILVLRSVFRLEKVMRPRLYFFDVWPGEQTNLFIPDKYVDISETAEKKIESLRCYETERINAPGRTVLADLNRQMEFRGKEAGVRYAEAFISLTRSVVQRAIPIV